MATSPKYRPAMPQRFPSGSRRYSQRQIILLLAFVLLITSGSMLVFHVVTGPLAGRSSRDKAAGCNKDADYTVIRWSSPPPAPQPGAGLGAAAIPNRDRPRVALPHRIDQEPEQQQPQEQPPVQAPQHMYQPPPQDMDQGSKDTDANRKMDQIMSHPNDSNAEDPEDVAVPEYEDEAEELLPFHETLDQQDNVQYVTYLPYAGITNQFYGMLRGMEVAKALGRTLIIPPITASSHDKSKQNQPWSKFLDLERFTELTGTKVIEFHELREEDQADFNSLSCGITCGFGSKRTIDFTAKGFLKQWKFNLTLTPLRTDASTLETITNVLAPLRRDKVICISNTYKIAVKDKSEWERFGQYLHFTSELEEFVQDFLDRNLVKPKAVYDPRSRQQIIPTQRYIAIHARRGDFAQYCQNNFPGKKLIHCLPSTEEFAERIDRIQADQNPSGSLQDYMPVFVATNERRPEELKKFADLGWRYLDHDAMGTAEALGVFGPMMVDQVFMAHAQVLVGIQMSTFSRVGALRQRDWNSREMEYM